MRKKKFWWKSHDSYHIMSINIQNVCRTINFKGIDRAELLEKVVGMSKFNSIFIAVFSSASILEWLMDTIGEIYCHSLDSRASWILIRSIVFYPTFPYFKHLFTPVVSISSAKWLKLSAQLKWETIVSIDFTKEMIEMTNTSERRSVNAENESLVMIMDWLNNRL